MKKTGYALMATVALLASGCATTTDPVADADAVAASDDGTAAVVYDEEAVRECRRKIRRTGTRIPRGACDPSLFSIGFHQRGEGVLGEADVPTN